jgi:hypothetical protein
MKFLFGIWTIAIALTVSAVAAYYSIIGLTAIFAAAVIPVIIMGVTLEVAKVTTAIWLHSFWNDAPFLIRTYLTTATLMLMLITSMGIFGFLSKAHIEQAASSQGMSAQIERVDQEILGLRQSIDRSTIAISGFGVRVTTADTDIQSRIAAQERLISDITVRLERDISTQNQMISQSNTVSAPLTDELNRIGEQRQALSSAQQANDVSRIQAIVSAKVDGAMGANTRRLINEFTNKLDTRQSEIITKLEILQTSKDPITTSARTEVTRLQQAANAEIAKAQDAINLFRNQLISITTTDNTADISLQEASINKANGEIDKLLAHKFDLQGQLRILEVEVGPVKYIAEFIYGDTNTEVLEAAVRWVIIIIVFVFDPLAIVLVLAGLRILENKPIDTIPEIPHNEILEDETPEIIIEDLVEEIPEETPVELLVKPIPTQQGKVIIDSRKTAAIKVTSK